MEGAMPERHLTVDELAERLGVPRRTVYAWNSVGGGPKFLRVGRHVRYKIADVEAWEKSRTVDRGRAEVAQA
jgi:excisionase family DNA binding protein